MNLLVDKVLAWLGTRHTEACDAQASANRAQGYTALCKCDFWQRAAEDFDRRSAQHKGKAED